MRNAGLNEMLNAHFGKPAVNTMYLVKNPWHGEVLAHYKHRYEFPNGVIGYMMESTQGCLIPCEPKWLSAIPRKAGTPKKEKKAHVQGSKPWLSKFEYVEYDPKLIKVGTKVLCRDKKVHSVKNVEPDYFKVGGHYIDLNSGRGNYLSKTHFHLDIMKILVEKAEQKVDILQNSEYCGYVPGEWHFWQGQFNLPPVGNNVKVAIWCRGNKREDIEDSVGLVAECYYWNWDNCDSDIIAFKIIS